MREAERGADGRSLVGVSRLANMRYMSFSPSESADFTTQDDRNVSGSHRKVADMLPDSHLADLISRVPK